MGETSHAKLLWAIIAPLAALAGVAWIHFKRKQKGMLNVLIPHIYPGIQI